LTSLRRTTPSLLFSSPCYAHHPALHSFPTRRSSDLHRRPSQRPSQPHRKLKRKKQTNNFRRARPSKRLRRRRQTLLKLQCMRPGDRKSTRLNSSHLGISYAVFCLKKKKKKKKKSNVI